MPVLLIQSVIYGFKIIACMIGVKCEFLFTVTVNSLAMN